MLSCLQLPEGLEHNALLYRFFIGSRFFFLAATRPTHSQGFGFSRLACRERSERNAKREKTYIIFSGGTEEKINNPFPKEIPLVPYLQEERMQIIK
jgi:hypothetical protein